MKNFASAILIGGTLMSTASTAIASTPSLPALTLDQKITISTYVVLAEIEQVDVMKEESLAEGHVYRKVPDDTAGGIRVLTVRVLKSLKLNGVEVPKRLRIVDKGWNKAYTVKTELIFFLKPEMFGKSEPVEIFQQLPVTTYPQRGDWARPELSERVTEVENLARQLSKSSN